jgi:hypothetical protein
MSTTMITQEYKPVAETERPKKPVLQAKNPIYQIKAEVLSAPIQAQIRHQQLVRVQQYYTGDA